MVSRPDRHGEVADSTRGRRSPVEGRWRVSGSILQVGAGIEAAELRRRCRRIWQRSADGAHEFAIWNGAALYGIRIVPVGGDAAAGELPPGMKPATAEAGAGRLSPLAYMAG